MKKLFPIIFLFSLLLIPQYAHAGLSEGCFPAVQCDSGEDYYADNCKTHLNSIADCGIAVAGKYYAFSCDDGCYLVTKPQAPECPGGIKIHGTCYTLLNIIDHNGIFKIWDGSLFSRLVYMSDSACSSGQVPTWDGSKWACGTVSGGGNSLWTASGNDIYNNNSGKVGIGTQTPVAELDVEGVLRVSGLKNCPLIESNASGDLSCGTLPASGSSLWTAKGSDIYYYKYTGKDATGKENTGKVGIGTVITPEALLHIKNDTGKQLMIGNNSQSNREWYFDADDSGKMILKNQNDGSPATIMSFYSANNSVGIGTDLPLFPLDVAGSVNINKGKSGVGALYVDSEEALWFNGTYFSWGGSGGNVTNYFARNVGIGVTAPVAELDIKGNMRVSGLKNCSLVESDADGDLSCGTFPAQEAVSSPWIQSGNNIQYNKGDVGIGKFPFTAKARLHVQADNEGAASIGSSLNSATGNQSVALVHNAQATGEYSVAVGYNVTASSSKSIAIGHGATASGSSAVAVGYNTTASGVYSTAMGHSMESQGMYSFGIGLDATQYTIASPNIMAITGGKVGIGTVAPNAQLTVVPPVGGGAATIGAFDKATGNYSVAIGLFTTASGHQSTSMGSGTTASGNNSVAMGSGTVASGNQAVAMGEGTKAIGINATAMGEKTTASGWYSTAIGNLTTASGNGSTAIGFSSQAEGMTSVAIGSYMKVTGDNSLGINLSTTNAVLSQKNTMAIMGGNVGIGTTSPSYLFDVAGPVNINKGKPGTSALYVNGKQAIWSDDTYFSWGYDGTWNRFADPVAIGSPDANGYKLRVHGTAAGNAAWVSLSDQRLKKGISTIENALDTVEKLRGVRFEWKDNKDYPSGKQIGFIAQEVKDVVPEVVTQGSDGYYSMSAGQLTAVLTEAVKELKSEVDRLNKRIEELEKK